MKPQDKIFVTLGSAAILAVAGFSGYALFTGGDTSTPTPDASQVTATTTPSTATQPSPSPSPTASSATATTYADGTYVATVRYYVPDDGQNTLQATVTISNGTVSAVNANDTYRDRKSRQYVDSFESHISSAVVGKPIANFSAGRIGGASLTSSAFNDALDNIRSDAKA